MKTYLVVTMGAEHYNAYTLQAESAESAKENLPSLMMLSDDEQVVDAHEIDPSKPAEFTFTLPRAEGKVRSIGNGAKVLLFQVKGPEYTFVYQVNAPNIRDGEWKLRHGVAFMPTDRIGDIVEIDPRATNVERVFTIRTGQQ